MKVADRTKVTDHIEVADRIKYQIVGSPALSPLSDFRDDKSMYFSCASIKEKVVPRLFALCSCLAAGAFFVLFILGY